MMLTDNMSYNQCKSAVNFHLKIQSAENSQPANQPKINTNNPTIQQSNQPINQTTAQTNKQTDK